MRSLVYMLENFWLNITIVWWRWYLSTTERYIHFSRYFWYSSWSPSSYVKQCYFKHTDRACASYCGSIRIQHDVISQLVRCKRYPKFALCAVKTNSLICVQVDWSSSYVDTCRRFTVQSTQYFRTVESAAHPHLHHRLRLARPGLVVDCYR